MHRQLIILHDTHSKLNNLPIYKLLQVYSKPFTKKNKLDNHIEHAVCCNDNTIDIVRNVFQERYICRQDIGKDYYYGDVRDMIDDVNAIIKNIDQTHVYDLRNI